MDNDDAGRTAALDAERQGLLEMRNITYTVCNGSPDAEIEDCFENPIILLLSFVITFLLFVTTSLFYCLIIPRFGQSH